MKQDMVARTVSLAPFTTFVTQMQQLQDKYNDAVHHRDSAKVATLLAAFEGTQVAFSRPQAFSPKFALRVTLIHITCSTIGVISFHNAGIQSSSVAQYVTLRLVNLICLRIALSLQSS